MRRLIETMIICDAVPVLECGSLLPLWVGVRKSGSKLPHSKCLHTRLICVLLLVVLPMAVLGETNAPVRSLGLAKTYTESARIFDAVCDPATGTNGVGQFLANTITACRQRATKLGKSPSSIGSMGGRWLEWAVVIALKEYKLTPVYPQAEFSAVPNNFNDVMLWSKEHGPVIISCKTSLRERYKQADLEAVALRQHYPGAKFFLLTLDEDKRHVANIRKKIAGKELLALHAIYDETNAGELFRFLKSLTIVPAPDGVLRSAKTVR